MVQPDFIKQDLIPVIIQDHITLKVLMLAYMNQDAYNKTLTDNIVHFYSRSRKRLWKKGESSGHIQIVKNIYLDCDNDTLLIQVEQVGKAACHEGYTSCFFKRITDNKIDICEEKVFDPEKVYK